MAEIADVRIHGTTHERPCDRFVQEQPVLIPTTTQPSFRLAGGGVNLNVHFHTLVLDGVFAELTPGRLQFHAATSSTDAAVAQVLATIRHRVGRLLARRGLEPGAAEPGPPDGLAEVSPILAQILSASVQGRVALGRHAGTRVGRLGGEPTEPADRARGPRQAHLEGFDL
jgi:hypothetical protein